MFNFFKKKPKVTEYTTIAGHNFRVLDATRLPTLRRVRFFLDEYSRDWGLNKDDLLSYLKFVINQTDVNTNDPLNKLKDIFALLTTLESVVKSDYQYKPYLKAASIIILIEGEDENKLDGKIIKQKLELCRDNSEIEAFFLRVIKDSFSNIQKQSDTSKVLDWQPSKLQKLMENSFYSKINSTIYDDGSS